MDKSNLSRPQRVFASLLVIAWGIVFFLIAVLAAIATAFCCGLALGRLGLVSDFYKDVAMVISGGVLFISIMFLLRWEKRRNFVLKSSYAVVQYFGHRHDPNP